MTLEANHGADAVVAGLKSADRHCTPRYVAILSRGFDHQGDDGEGGPFSVSATSRVAVTFDPAAAP